MPKIAMNFPPRLRHSSGRMISLDRSRLLLAFKRSQDPDKHKARQKVSELLPGTGLVLEQYLFYEADGEKLPAEAVNHTSQRFWVRTEHGKSISKKTWRTLDTNEWRKRLAWIGPVYKFAGTVGRQGLASPLPHSLLIKPKGQVGSPPIKLLTPRKLAKLGLKKAKKQPRKSQYCCCLPLKPLNDPRKTALLEVYRDILKTKTPAFKKASLEAAELDYMPLLIPFASPPGNPNNQYYGLQTNLQRINAPAGWNVSNPPISGLGVVVAVIDQGCDLQHPDLQGAFTKDGATFNKRGDVVDVIEDGGPADPGDNHGTQCAGIIAARHDNALGVAGLAFESQIMSLRLNNQTPEELAKAIEYASDNGAQVISISLASPTFQHVRVEEALNKASAKDVVVCAASGNVGAKQIDYPAAYAAADPDLVIACGACCPDLDPAKSTEPQLDIRADFIGYWASNYGPGLSVVAPGVDIPTTKNNNNHTMHFSMTSAATPHVAALAALVFHRYGRKSNTQVRDIIESTATKINNSNHQRVPGTYVYKNDTNGLRHDEVGYGCINVFAALQ